MIFVMMADYAFAPWVSLALEALTRSNPSKRVLIYDLSDLPSPRLADAVRQHAVAELIPWPPSCWSTPGWTHAAGFEFFWPHWALKDELKRIGRVVRWKLFGQRKDSWILDKTESLQRQRRFVTIVCQKPAVIWDALQRSGQDIAFVDADAIILGRFDEMPVPNVNCAFTVLNEADLRVGVDTRCAYPEITPYSAINTGVMFFRRDLAREFIEEWQREIERVPHMYAEQTALACLLWRADHSIYRHASLSAATQWFLNLPSGHSIAFALLPCAIYNLYRLSANQVVAEDVKIIHFVGSWKQTNKWGTVKKICARLFARTGGAPQ